jgi:hypothetical protein
MFEQFWRLLSRRKKAAPEVASDAAPSEPIPSEADYDIHFVSLAMLYLLVDATPTISRDDLAAILREQFGDINFAVWFNLEDFYATAMRPEFTIGFQSMAVLAFLVLGTDMPISKIVETIRQTFEVPGAKDLPEYIEAECRFLAPNIPACDLTVDHYA